MVKKKAKPHSIKCLRAIEGYYGGRDSVAKKIKVSKAAINRWHVVESIPASSILKLSKLIDGKFSIEDLIGQND